MSGGYDAAVRLYDLTTGALLRSLVGHERSVSSAVFNTAGNLIVSGGKDATVRFWDTRSGLCLKCFESPLGEVGSAVASRPAASLHTSEPCHCCEQVTSVDLAPNGVHLVSSSKDNALRLWDVRTAKPLLVLKGHQNTARNFVRARFAKGGTLVASGSDDGGAFLWHASSGELAARLGGHTDVVYDTAWSEPLDLIATASHDGLIKLWGWDAAAPGSVAGSAAAGWDGPWRNAPAGGAV